MKSYEILELPNRDRDKKWANAAGKMGLWDLLDTGLPQTFNWYSTRVSVKHNKAKWDKMRHACNGTRGKQHPNFQELHIVRDATSNRATCQKHPIVSTEKANGNFILFCSQNVLLRHCLRYDRSGVGKWQPSTCLVNKVLLERATVIHLQSIFGCFGLQNVWPAKPEIFTSWPFSLCNFGIWGLVFNELWFIWAFCFCYFWKAMFQENF